MLPEDTREDTRDEVLFGLFEFESQDYESSRHSPRGDRGRHRAVIHGCLPRQFFLEERNENHHQMSSPNLPSHYVLAILDEMGEGRLYRLQARREKPRVFRIPSCDPLYQR